MSQKMREKSSKLSAGKPARAESKASTKGPSPDKSGKNATNRQPASSPPKAPRKPASKASSPSGAGKTGAPTAPGSKAANPPTKAGVVARSGLAEGAKAPSFRLPRDGGGTVSLADFAGQKLALFFYPRADTPVCTREAIDFTRLSGAFAGSKTAVLGVSADPVRAQEAFRSKHQLTIPLASDEKHEMLEAYGVWGEKSMYGKVFHGILRTTVLIGVDGRIVRIWRHVRVDGHADEVLAAAKAA